MVDSPFINIVAEEVKENIEGLNKLRMMTRLANDYDVLVGIPTRNAGRSKSEVNNAELAYIHTRGVLKKDLRREINDLVEKGNNYEGARKKVYDMWLMEHGSPAYAIPPRPIIEPALNDCKDRIVDKLTKSLRLFFEGETEDAEKELAMLGQYASQQVKTLYI